MCVVNPPQPKKYSVPFIRADFSEPFAYRFLGRKNGKIAGVPFIRESRLLHSPFIWGVIPFLSTFWPFWAKVAHTGEFPGPPWSAGLKNSVTYPRGGAEALTRKGGGPLRVREGGPDRAPENEMGFP